MASYAGVPIFGLGVTMATFDFPRKAQMNSFFGVSGVESLDGGFRGRMTRVQGVLLGSSPAELAGAEGLFRTYNDGFARTLIDNLGTTWLNVKMVRFVPFGRVRRLADGSCMRGYRALFLHLT